MTAGFVRPARLLDADAIVSAALAAWSQMPWLSLGQESAASDEMSAQWQSLLHTMGNAPSTTSEQSMLPDGGATLAPVPDAAVLVATEANDHVIGWLLLSAAHDSLPGGVCEVLDLVVAPEHQRQGHGSRLMHAAADTARQRGAAWLCTWCPLPDEPRRAFLIAHGFAPDGAVRDLAGGGSSTEALSGEPSEQDIMLREVRLIANLGADEDR